jgi:Glycosyltransferase (GlcNAc)
MNAQIYIQIPAYRDNQLQPTLHDLMENASNKDQLRVGVAWQYGENERLDQHFLKKYPIEIIAIPARQSKGCNWARALLQERWADEAYTLLLDSHHRFVPGWDAELIRMFRDLKAGGVPKPLITTYLPTYDPANDPAARRQEPLAIRFDGREKGLLFRLRSKVLPFWQTLSTPVTAGFTSLHFLFAEGSLNEEIEFNPSIYFFADEVAISLRVFTHGYDLFHPHKVLGWHLYNRTATRVPHWNDHPEWRAQHAQTLTELRKLYSGQKTGRFGIGSARSINAYEQLIGLPLIQF